MLAVFVPIIRPQGKKDADSYQHDFEEQVEKRALSAAKLMRESIGAWSGEQGAGGRW